MLAQYFDRIDESIDALLATDLTETQKKSDLGVGERL